MARIAVLHLVGDLLVGERDAALERELADDRLAVVGVDLGDLARPVVGQRLDLGGETGKARLIGQHQARQPPGDDRQDDERQ